MFSAHKTVHPTAAQPCSHAARGMERPPPLQTDGCNVVPDLYLVYQILSDTTYLFISFRESALSQNRELNVLISNSEH